jgi:3-isopropylmalate/(R)-2-methylmalate dehydratase small subunit
MSALVSSQTPLTTLTGSMVPFLRHDVDTDQIIPARFLKGTEKTGLGKHLFYDWRYMSDGTPNAGFVLNQPAYAHGRVLVSGHNFGCGSSREHAPWALKDYGFSVVLAISFADIFRNNALKNQVLPIPLPEALITRLVELATQSPDTPITVNVREQLVQLPPACHTAFGQTVAFDLDPFRKTCLLQGVDDIGYTLTQLSAIDAFEAN